MTPKITPSIYPVDLNLLSPFFFIIDGHNTIKEAGRSLQKLMPDVIGASFKEIFLLENNDADELNHTLINRCILLKGAKINISFHGCLTALDKNGELLFIGSPSITSADTLNNLGLNVQDFACHDTIRNTYKLIDNQEKTNNEIRQIAENQLIESDLLHKIIDMVPQQIFLKDSQARFRLVNKWMAGLFGADIADIIGKKDQDFWPEKDEVTLYTDIDTKVIETGETFEIPEEPQTKRDGTKCINRVVKMPFTLANGERCVLGIAIDITQIKEAERKLQLYNEELEAEIRKRTQELHDKNKELINYNNQLEEYAFTISHYVKAPVARLLGLGNILNLNDIADPVNIVVLPKIAETTKLLNDVISDLNKIIQIKSIENRLTQVDLFNILKKTVTIFKDQLTSLNGVIEIDVDRNIIFYSDAGYLESIFHNLISNAIKFRSERALHITISAYTENNQVYITISDNGIGIDMNVAKGKIFGLYQRFNLHIEGNGFGLNLVKEQIKALEGTIDVSSQLDQGTSFMIRLPLKSQPAHATFASFKPVSLYV